MTAGSDRAFKAVQLLQQQPSPATIYDAKRQKLQQQLAALDAGEQHRHEQLPQPCAVAATAAAAVFVAATAAAAAICSASSQHHCRCSSLLCARPTSSATSWQMWAGSMAAGQHSTAAG